MCVGGSQLFTSAPVPIPAGHESQEGQWMGGLALPAISFPDQARIQGAHARSLVGAGAGQDECAFVYVWLV